MKINFQEQAIAVLSTLPKGQRQAFAIAANGSVVKRSNSHNDAELRALNGVDIVEAWIDEKGEFRLIPCRSFRPCAITRIDQ